MIFEKKWPSVILSPITVTNSIITVSSTVGLHPKQIITLTQSGTAQEFEVKRVLSSTQLQIGAIGRGITAFLNPVQFNGGTLSAVEQERNAIDSNAGIRASYAEEPTVAIRTTLVDYFGRNYATKEDLNGNPVLKVDASLVSDLIAGIDYDSITPTYTTLTDTWTYRKGTDIVRTITITYTDSTKEIISPVGGVVYV